MMKKAKITLLTLLVAVLSLCCFAFVACNDDGGNGPAAKQYTIKWSVDETLSVAVEGYNALPTTVDENTEFTFTVTPNTEGWSISSVAPMNNMTKVSDGVYKVKPVNKDLEIRIRAREDVESIEVKKPNGDIKYNAGDKFLVEEEDANGNKTLKLPKDWGFTAKFKTGRTEDLDVSKLNIKYQTENADSFSLGDTKFTVEYGNGSAVVNLTAAVMGKITVNVGNGDWDSDTVAALKTKFNNNVTSRIDAEHENAKIYEILYATAFEEDYTLPAPSVTMDMGDGVEFSFPVKQWYGLAGGKIAQGTKTSVQASVDYDIRLVDFKELSFITKNVMDTVEGEQVEAKNVPFFIIKGDFVAVDKATLYLREGNAPATELYGTEVVRSEDTDEFTLEFDLRELVRWTNPKQKEEGDKNYKGTLKGAWNDIKFRVSQGSKHVDQEIDLNDYADDYFDYGATLESNVDGVDVQFLYKIHTPDDTTHRNLKITYQDRPDVVANQATLVEHEFTVTTGEGDNATTTKTTLPAIAVTVTHYTIESEDALKTYASNYLSQPQVLDAWNDVVMKSDYTVDFANKKLTFYYSLEDVKNYEGKPVFFHLNGSGNNFYNCSLGNKTLLDGDTDMAYKLHLFASTDWKGGLVVVEYKSIKETTAKPVTIEVNGDKAYLVISGTYLNWTEEDFKAAIKLDFEDSTNGQNKIVLDAEKIELEFNEDGTYTIKADVTEIGTGAWWLHLTGVLSGNGDIGNDDGIEPLTCGTKTFGFVEKTFDWGKKMLFTVGEAAAE